MDRIDTRIPVILVTGLLGAGKTTLLLRWLKESPATGLRMGVVMNEFGAENIDSQILARPELPIEQVSGGCICCASDTDIDRAITRLIKSELCDYVVVETSGLADPDNVIDILTDPDLFAKTRLQGVVTVVDGEWYGNPDTDPAETILARRQISFANVVALSRSDRLTEESRLELDQRIRQVNSHATLVRMPFGLPDLNRILAGPGVEGRIDPQPSTAFETHLHEHFQSLTWHFPFAIERERFEGYLKGLDPKDVVRAKGFVRFKEKPDVLFLFQTVRGYRVIDEFPAKPHPDTVAVLIGPRLNAAAHQEKLRRLFFGTGANLLAKN
ncbi:MAG TPA: GTP-binding protein [Candidatus Limnocylindria bacterium]|nr:GTP-binding protein [Candidatus Limnocylindria bacterium]